MKPILLVAIAASTLPAAENAPLPKPAGVETHITSKAVEFDLKTRTAVYSGNVRVDDPRVSLTCELLTARLPASGTRVDSIVAETNVVMLIPEKGTTNRATADKAVYLFSVRAGVTNEILELTGSPAIETPQGTMTGTKITWDRGRDNLSAENSHMIYKPAATNAAPTDVSTNAAPATNAPEAKSTTP